MPRTARHIGTLHLKNVIWQGRNQAIHWEEGGFTQPVRDCVPRRWRGIQDPKFNEYTSRNMAFAVVSLLGWSDIPDFDRDMLSLG